MEHIGELAADRRNVAGNRVIPRQPHSGLEWWFDIVILVDSVRKSVVNVEIDIDAYYISVLLCPLMRTKHRTTFFLFPNYMQTFLVKTR